MRSVHAVNMNGDRTMRNSGIAALLLGALTLCSSCSHAVADTPPETIIALERGALDRWGKGDPQGYVDIYAPDITYYDPMLDKRVDGLTAMKEYLRPIAGKVHIDSYELIDPKVQQTGDIALLTVNVLSHARTPAGQPIDVRWNSTEVYRRSQGQWRIIHSHWSFTRPTLAQPVGP